MKNNSFYTNVQVYNVWVFGVPIEDEEELTPIHSSAQIEWHDNFKKAYDEYFNCIVPPETELYKCYITILYSIDINIKEFENMFDLDFDLKGGDVQEMIPYYVDHNLNVVAERISDF